MRGSWRLQARPTQRLWRSRAQHRVAARQPGVSCLPAALPAPAGEPRLLSGPQGRGCRPPVVPAQACRAAPATSAYSNALSIRRRAACAPLPAHPRMRPPTLPARRYPPSEGCEAGDSEDQPWHVVFQSPAVCRNHRLPAAALDWAHSRVAALAAVQQQQQQRQQQHQQERGEEPEESPQPEAAPAAPQDGGAAAPRGVAQVLSPALSAPPRRSTAAAAGAPPPPPGSCSRCQGSRLQRSGGCGAQAQSRRARPEAQLQLTWRRRRWRRRAAEPLH